MRRMYSMEVYLQDRSGVMVEAAIIGEASGCTGTLCRTPAEMFHGDQDVWEEESKGVATASA